MQTRWSHMKTFIAVFAALAVMAAAMAVQAMAATDLGDDIPQADSLAALSATFGETLDANTDKDDVLYIDLTKGEYLLFEMTGASGTDFDIDIFSPTATTVDSSDPAYELPVGSSRTDTYPEKVVFQALTTGRHYVDLWAYMGSGAYTSTWSTSAASADDDIPGVPLPASPVAGKFDTITDWRDVYSTSLAEDQYLELTLTGDPGTDFDLYLWSPDATSVINVGISPYVAVSNETNSSNESITYLCPPGGGGTYYIEVYDFNTGSTGGGDYTLTWKKTMPDVARLYGQNRYDTSLAISRSDFTSADYVVLATGANYPDALAASGLAGLLDCPVILLPQTESMPFDTLQEIYRLGVKKAYVVGGTGVVHPAIPIDLQLAGYEVERLAGGDRYATARAVADEMIELGATPDTAFLVSGQSFADALSVSPYAFEQGYPILLTRPTSLPDVTKTFIEQNAIDDVIVAGGTGAVSSSVAAVVDGLRSGAVDVHREGGIDRYETAAKVAKYCADTRGWATWDYVGVATGANFPDALSGGAACGTRGGTLLLTRPTSLPNVTRTTMESKSASIDMTLLFGGTGAVSDGVKNAIEDAMQ